MNYFCICAVGFIVAVGTRLVLGKKGLLFPGGSLAAGILLAVWLGDRVSSGAMLGILGWFVFVAPIVLSNRK